MLSKRGTVIMETKNCQNCKNDFTIEPEDFDFYAKIDVPPPTFCPECRMIRRMLWRNVRSLHKRECGLCKKVLISMYKDDGAPVYCRECFSSDNWDPYSYGLDINNSKTFLSQVFELFKKVPRPYAYHTGTLINSDYTNYSADNKNAYLAYSVIGCEDIMYSETIDKSKNCLDCYAVQKLDSCYANVGGSGNYNCIYAIDSTSCIDSFFIFDCKNCQDCMFSSNITNKRYVFGNVQYTKEEYFIKTQEFNLSSYGQFNKAINIFNDEIIKNSIHRYAHIYNSQNASGDYVNNSKNIKYGFDIADSENIKYSSRVLLNCKDSYDQQGLAQGELNYECVAASFGTYKDLACYITLGSKECEYSGLLRNCSNCFGCFGLVNAQYCILNKQYSKEEYDERVSQIKKGMLENPYVDKKGRVYGYGEFFPYEFSPFALNETVAIDYFRFKKDEIIEKGYPWKSRENRDYKTTMNSLDLPDSILDVSDDILKEIIACPNNGNEMTQCTTAYKITPEELQFYRQKKLPLPRFCPNCRHYERLQYRNPMKLYSRQCTCDVPNHDHEGRCEVEFETSYAPDRPEKVYCEKCYQKEVL